MDLHSRFRRQVACLETIEPCRYVSQFVQFAGRTHLGCGNAGANTAERHFGRNWNSNAKTYYENNSAAFVTLVLLSWLRSNQRESHWSTSDVFMVRRNGPTGSAIATAHWQGSGKAWLDRRRDTGNVVCWGAHATHRNGKHGVAGVSRDCPYFMGLAARRGSANQERPVKQINGQCYSNVAWTEDWWLIRTHAEIFVH